jgi:hypothetical protein
MSTERQQQASRENGSKSHGPVTSTGKFNSSQNALKHGMLSDTVVLKCESTDRFLSLVATLFEEFQPQTPFEESLIEDMAVARWRRMRIRGMETAGMDYEMRKQSDTAHPIAPEIEHADNATRAWLAFRTVSDDSRALDLINRYDARYQREYLRAHRRFVEVRDRRTPPALQPAPIEESETSKGTPEVIANKPEPPEPCTDGGPAAGALQPESDRDASVTSLSPTAKGSHSNPVALTVLPSADSRHDKLPDDPTRSINK